MAGKEKRPIEEHCDINFELEYSVQQTGKDGLLALLEEITGIRVNFIRQKCHKDLGDAV